MSLLVPCFTALFNENVVHEPDVSEQSQTAALVLVWWGFLGKAGHCVSDHMLKQ